MNLYTLAALKPFELTRYSNTILGKVVLLLGVAFVSLRMGKLPGLLAALVMIVLIYDNVEGFGIDSNGKDDDEKKAEDTDATLENINTQETKDPIVKTIEDKEKCEKLKKDLMDKVGDDFDFSQYDVKCKEGELRIKAFKNSVAATQENN